MLIRGLCLLFLIALFELLFGRVLASKSKLDLDVFYVELFQGDVTRQQSLPGSVCSFSDASQQPPEEKSANDGDDDGGLTQEQIDELFQNTSSAEEEPSPQAEKMAEPKPAQDDVQKDIFSSEAHDGMAERSASNDGPNEGEKVRDCAADFFSCLSLTRRLKRKFSKFWGER